MEKTKAKDKTTLEKALERLDAAYKKKDRERRMRIFSSPERNKGSLPLPYKDD